MWVGKLLPEHGAASLVLANLIFVLESQTNIVQAF